MNLSEEQRIRKIVCSIIKQCAKDLDEEMVYFCDGFDGSALIDILSGMIINVLSKEYQEAEELSDEEMDWIDSDVFFDPYTNDYICYQATLEAETNILRRIFACTPVIAYDLLTEILIGFVDSLEEYTGSVL